MEKIFVQLNKINLKTEFVYQDNLTDMEIMIYLDLKYGFNKWYGFCRELRSRENYQKRILNND